MKKVVFVLMLLSVLISANAQEKVKIYGSVYDAKSMESLPTATLLNIVTNKGTVCNTFGDYSMVVEAGEVNIEVSFMGYKAKIFRMVLNSDTLLNIGLLSGIELKEMVVTASSQGVSSSKTVGLMQLPISSIAFSPSFAGENNLVTTLKTLPGVSAGKEGGSELYVRGGRHDQNLILLDGSPVYNLSHAFGLLSVFNAPSIKNVNLYKGAIPAQYGGRLSSVLDISVREGHRSEYHGDVTISTLAAGLTLEGPIVKDKASFLISARRSWPDLLVLAAMSGANEAEYVPGVYFNDINAKVNFTLWNKQHFYLSYYTGQDEMFVRSKNKDLKSEMSQGWGNHLATLRWNTLTDNGYLLDASTHHSTFFDYNKSFYKTEKSKQASEQSSLMQEIGLKINARKTLSDYFNLHVGMEMNTRLFQLPGTQYESNSTVKTYDRGEEFQHTLAPYATLIYSAKRFASSLGIRTSMFGSKINEHIFVEPRLSVNYNLTEQVSLKAGAMYNVQPLYAMNKANNGFPGYVWVPLSNKLKPQTAYQVSGGFHWNTLLNLQLDVEGYYKRSSHVAGNYLYSTTIYPSHKWYEYINQGDGRAYGCDVLIEYSQKKWDARIGYSLANSQVRMDAINFGRWFPFEYDIRHELNISGSWQVQTSNKGKKWFTYNFALHSGTPVTLPSQSIKSIQPLFGNHNTMFTEGANLYYSHPNNYHLKPYHRLDFAFNMEKYKKVGSRIWSVGLINAYSRYNPYIIYQDDGKFKELVMFPLMPVVSFKRVF